MLEMTWTEIPERPFNPADATTTERIVAVSAEMLPGAGVSCVYFNITTQVFHREYRYLSKSRWMVGTIRF